MISIGHINLSFLYQGLDSALILLFSFLLLNALKLYLLIVNYMEQNSEIFIPICNMYVKLKNADSKRFLFVRGRGLEPPCLAALAPKASVSAISPPAH